MIVALIVLAIMYAITVVMGLDHIIKQNKRIDKAVGKIHSLLLIIQAKDKVANKCSKK